MESLVTACHHRAVNTSLLLAHTARRSIRVGYRRGAVINGRDEPELREEGEGVTRWP
jgi:hypothetical protein